MNRSQKAMKKVLREAESIICGARQNAYGTPFENHSRTAAFWSLYLGIPISPRQVCLLNVLQKISRDMNSSKPDNILDIIGFAANIEGVNADDPQCLCGECESPSRFATRPRASSKRSGTSSASKKLRASRRPSAAVSSKRSGKARRALVGV